MLSFTQKNIVLVGFFVVILAIAYTILVANRQSETTEATPPYISNQPAEESSSKTTLPAPIILSNPNTFETNSLDSKQPVPETGADFNVKVSLGAARHQFNTLLGGVVWTASRKNAREMAKAMPFFKGEVLLDIKTQANGFGYRFDTNTFESGTIEYGYYKHDGTDEQEPINLDDAFQIFDAPNAKFILHIPAPNESLKLGSERFSWQTPEFYAAELQYLFGVADSPEIYSALPASVDFFAANTPADFNFANLRARRGHPAPYKAEAVIFGQEPYHIEGWGAGDGAGFGARVEQYRAAMRKRGIDLPYGVHTSQLPPSNRSWFKPLMAALPKNDLPKYIDLYHHYSFAVNDDWLRVFPIAERAQGFTDWWQPREFWQANYKKFLWIIEDTKLALEDIGINPENMKIGFGEHGITISSPFRYNDMTGGIHFALWLSEIMRYDTDFDSMWVLLGEGFSTAQVQYRNGALTRTPAFFVYEMANEFKGLTYRETSTDSPTGAAINPEGQSASFPYVIVRAFEKDANTIEIFAINQHSEKSAKLSGLPFNKIKEWRQLKGENFASGNPLDGSGAHPVKTETLKIVSDTKLILPPVSVNRIILAK